MYIFIGIVQREITEHNGTRDRRKMGQSSLPIAQWARAHYFTHLLLYFMLSCFGLVWLFCDPMDRSPPGSSVHGISQAGIPEWVAIFFSRGSSRPRDRTESPASPSLAGRFFTTEPPGKRFWDDSHILYSDMGLYYMFICKRLWSFMHFTVCKFHPPSQTVNQEALKGNWTDIINLLWNASKSKTDWWMDIDKASIMKCKW